MDKKSDRRSEIGTNNWTIYLIWTCFNRRRSRIVHWLFVLWCFFSWFNFWLFIHRCTAVISSCILRIRIFKWNSLLNDLSCVSRIFSPPHIIDWTQIKCPSPKSFEVHLRRKKHLRIRNLPEVYYFLSCLLQGKVGLFQKTFLELSLLHHTLEWTLSLYLQGVLWD